MKIGEIWKALPLAPKYEVSSWGKVRNAKSGRIIKVWVNKKGYNKVTLMVDDVKHNYRVGRLVALAFIENPHNYTQVNHIDGNNQNDSISNLEWCTNRENCDHATTLKKIMKGRKIYDGTEFTRED